MSTSKAKARFSIGLVLALVSGLFAAAPAHADVACSGGGSIVVNNDAVTGSIDCRGSVEIPANVVQISSYAFANRMFLTSVTFAQGTQIRRIMPQAFPNASISSITLPQGLEYIGAEAFQYTQLTNVTIPSTVTVIGTSAFSNARLAEVIFTGPAPRLDGNVFSNNPGAIARIGAGLTGYPTSGAFWQGLIVRNAELSAALTPSFGTPTSGWGAALDGDASDTAVNITNFDPSFTYSATSNFGTASIDGAGLLRISGHRVLDNLSVVVTTRKSGHLDGSATFTYPGDYGKGGIPATFGTVTKIAGGFEALITNFDETFPSYAYSATSTAGSASVVSRGNQKYLVVTGMQPGQTATATVTYLRWGRSPADSSVTGTSLIVLTAPLYQSAFAQSATSAFVTWGSVDGATSYTVTASNGGGTCTNTINYCTVTGLTAGQTYTFSVVANGGGQSSPASVTTPVLMASALDVGGSLTSSTWKVGAVVVANPLIIGQYSILRHQWYRCAAAVGVQEAAPACDAIAGATGGTYTLTAADLGKYVTSHMTVTGGAGVVTATLANTRAVLAANAAGGALVDPDGKPLIAEIPTRQISVVGGTTITITGTGFKDVTSVLVNGTPATVLSATDTTLVISVPASTQVGLVDLAVTTPKGTVTEASALAYVAKQASISSKKKTLTGFSGSAIKLSTKQKAEIKAFVKANSTMPKLTCAASTVGVKKSSTETKAALARAKAACSYAASVSKNVFTSSNGAQGKTTGKVSKLVTLTISN